MKIETIGDENTFKPYTISITIESLEEHSSLLDLCAYDARIPEHLYNAGIITGSEKDLLKNLMKNLFDAIPDRN